RFPMPRSGYARIPVVTQNTKVDTRNAQFGEPASQALTVSTQDFNAVWLDGAVEVSLEIIQTSEPGVMGMIWSDLLAQLAGKQEALAISTMVNAGTETGAALPKDTYKNFAKAVATQAIQVRNATGAAANSLAIPYADWPDIIAMVD